MLRFFGHMARAKQDHHPVIGASLRPHSHWSRPCGRPCTSWPRATDTDMGLQSVNIAIHWSWRKASNRTLWRRIIDTATLFHSRSRRVIMVSGYGQKFSFTLFASRIQGRFVWYCGVQFILQCSQNIRNNSVLSVLSRPMWACNDRLEYCSAMKIENHK